MSLLLLRCTDFEMSSGVIVLMSRIGPDEFPFKALLLPEPGGPISNRLFVKLRLSGGSTPGDAYNCRTYSGLTTNRNRRIGPKAASMAVSQNDTSGSIGKAARAGLPLA